MYLAATMRKTMCILRLLVSAIIGVGFFIVPLHYGGRSTVLFDIFVKHITKGYPTAVGYYCFALILFGAIATLLERFSPNKKIVETFSYYRSSSLFVLLRCVGFILAILMLFNIGPEVILQKKIAGLMWNILVFAVGVIIPVGAIVLNIFISYGCLEFVGTLMRPLMRPLFKLPGRSALDDLASWIGSYSVGLYMTRKLVNNGYYNRRETYTIVTCFSTVSIGFVGVVAATLDLLHMFPIIFLTYFVVVYLLTVILVRIWPISRVPTTYVAQAMPEREVHGGIKEYWRLAVQRSLHKAHDAPSFLTVAREGFVDGLKLATTILGTILAVGTLALLLAKYTPVFDYLGAPLVPILSALGIPDAQTVAPATVVGISEMYIPALLVKNAPLPARFFICVLSISQLIFFSSVGPMMMDMFKDIPVRFRELVALFFIRTAILIPILAAVTWILF